MKKSESGSGGASKQPAVRKRYVSVNSRENRNVNEHETVKPGLTFGSEKSGSGNVESRSGDAENRRSSFENRRVSVKSKRSNAGRAEKNKAEKTRAHKAVKSTGSQRNKKTKKRQPGGRTEYYRFEKIVWAVLGSFVLLVGLALGARLIIGRMFNNDYDNFRYEKAVREEKLLIRVNFPEGYIPFYNIGCAYYEEGEYQQAEAWFRRALRQGAPHREAQEQGNVSSGNPSEGSTDGAVNEEPSEGSTQTIPDLGAPTRASAGAGFFSANSADAECDIRVNAALSIIGQIDPDLLDTESGRTKAIEKLQNARSVLTAEGCASADDEGGHDEAAVQLRDEIDEWLSRLREEDRNPENKEDDSDDSNGGQDDSSGQDSDGGGNGTDQSDESSGNGNSGENASGGSAGEDSDDSNSGSGNSSGSGSGSGGGSGSSNSSGGSDIDENRVRREIERSMEESREEQRQSEEDEKYYEYYYYGNGDEGNGGIWW